MPSLQRPETVDVSVVIPTRNRARMVTEAVQSVLDQVPAPAEVLVIDDASEDDTAEQLAQFGERILVHRTPQRIERGAARNLGAQMACCDGLAFLDADDLWLPGKLAAQRPAHDRGVPSITGIQFAGADGAPTGRTCIPPVLTRATIIRTNPAMGCASSLLIPRATFHAVGGFPTTWAVQGSEDWLLMFRLVDAGAIPEVIGEPLVAYRVHASNSQGDAGSVARSQSAAVRWLGREGDLDRREMTRAAGSTAARIAQLYANRGAYRESVSWLGRTARSGSAVEFARGLWLSSGSAARGAKRRHSSAQKRRPISDQA